MLEPGGEILEDGGRVLPSAGEAVAVVLMARRNYLAPPKV
jgi:hypothetical protein